MFSLCLLKQLDSMHPKFCNDSTKTLGLYLGHQHMCFWGVLPVAAGLLQTVRLPSPSAQHLLLIYGWKFNLATETTRTAKHLQIEEKVVTIIVAYCCIITI